MHLQRMGVPTNIATNFMNKLFLYSTHLLGMAFKLFACRLLFVSPNERCTRHNCFATCFSFSVCCHLVIYHCSKPEKLYNSQCMSVIKFSAGPIKCLAQKDTLFPHSMKICNHTLCSFNENWISILMWLFTFLRDSFFFLLARCKEEPKENKKKIQSI